MVTVRQIVAVKGLQTANKRHLIGKTAIPPVVAA
jgi:hypothetical protein